MEQRIRTQHHTHCFTRTSTLCCGDWKHGGFNEKNMKKIPLKVEINAYIRSGH